MTSSNRAGRRAVLLLTAQALALGLALAWVTIPANTIFLDAFGPGLLPATYIGAAGAGMAASGLLARSLRRRALTVVATRILACMSLVLAAAWLMLWLADAPWISFALVSMLPIAIPIGFMFIVGQAGALLDVRALKAMYPIIIAGFALGFAAGGLGGSALVGIIGGPDSLLAAAAVATAVLLFLVLATTRRFPRELSKAADSSEESEPVRLRALLSNRYVVLIMGFQMLSAVESQWLDFLVYDRAAHRYSSTTALAQFVGRFSAAQYGADIVFLLVFAGLLLRRFGLRYGLTANPCVVLTMVLAAIIASTGQGSGTTLVFGLLVVTRVSDMVLSDGTSRTSVGAAYQAVPDEQRLAAQANVESLAVPVAIGVSGVVLLALRGTVGTG